MNCLLQFSNHQNQLRGNPDIKNTVHRFAPRLTGFALVGLIGMSAPALAAQRAPVKKAAAKQDTQAKPAAAAPKPAAKRTPLYSPKASLTKQATANRARAMNAE